MFSPLIYSTHTIKTFSPVFFLLSLQLQHLATFIMDKSESIVTVDDAIRKLILLNSKEKIWTQEMLLQVNDKSIRLLDCESQVPRALQELPTD